MNYDVYRSMDALEAARRIEPVNFLAQFKYAELYYRIRALDRAEAETTRALELAGTSWELSIARRQLSEIRRLRREGRRSPHGRNRETSCHRICGPPNGDLLVLYGLEMKYKWQYFLAAVFFASYLLFLEGTLLPVLAGCVVGALVTWWRLVRQDARGR